MYPGFRLKGPAGTAQEKQTVVVADVRTDPPYQTAFGSTLSEIIVPLVDEKGATVVSTMDVESQRVNAFSVDDQHMLENAAWAVGPLFREQQ